MTRILLVQARDLRPDDILCDAAGGHQGVVRVVTRGKRQTTAEFYDVLRPVAYKSTKWLLLLDKEVTDE